MAQKIRVILFTLLISILSISIFSCIPSQEISQKIYSHNRIPEIRVLIDTKNQNSNLEIESEDILFVNDIPSKSKITISILNTFLAIDGLQTHTNELKISSTKAIKYDRNYYPGYIRILYKDKKIYAINHVDIETYLRGVVPNEVIPSWPIQTLKAQAIASRTYALKKILENKNNFFDVYSTYKSQVYKGLHRTHPRTDQAIKETFGMVITHKGEIINAFFHANSGGLLEDESIITPTELPYIKPINDKFSQNTFRSSWTLHISKKDFLEKIGLEGELKKIEVIERSPNKSVKTLKITYIQNSKEKEKILSIHYLRELIPQILSPKFTFKITKTKIEFDGYGWGHGVGMSQWGAKEMALNGYSYKEILKYYYDNVEIMKIY